MTCPHCGHAAEFHSHRGHAPLSLVGPVRYERAYYLCRRCGAGTFPFDEAAGLTARRLTPALARVTTLAGAVAGRLRSGGRTRHLLVGSPSQEGETGRVSGFAYGSYVPGLGGYACYLGVDPEERGRGTGTLLLRGLMAAMQADAERLGRKLPLVVWESRMPEPEASAAERQLWQARLRLS